MNYMNMTIAFGFVLLVAIALKINERRNKKKTPSPVVETKKVTIGRGGDFKNLQEFFDSLPADMTKTPVNYVAELVPYSGQNELALPVKDFVKLTSNRNSFVIRPAPGEKIDVKFKE